MREEVKEEEKCKKQRSICVTLRKDFVGMYCTTYADVAVNLMNTVHSTDAQWRRMILIQRREIDKSI